MCTLRLRYLSKGANNAQEREREKREGAICQSAAALELNRDLGEVLTPRCLNITIMMINVNGLFKRSFSEGQLTFIGYKVFCDIHTMLRVKLLHPQKNGTV